MSDIINSTSQSIPDSFKEQNIAQEEIKQSLIISENLKKPEQLKKQPLPNFKIKPMIPPDMPLNKQNLEEIEKELSILESLSPKQRSKFSDQLMQKEFMFIDPLIEQKFSQLASISPKELKPLIKQLKENISQLKKTANKLKELDPKKADLILNTLQEISNIETEYTSLKQQKKLINQLEKQTASLMENQQLEPKIGNVLLLFLAFAKSQMDQNDKTMLAGIEQTKVKTAQLEINAEAIKNQANQSVQGRHMSAASAAILTIAVFGLCFLALTGIGALAGMGLLSGTLAIGGGLMGSSSLAAGITSGLITGLSAGSICIAAYKNPELPSLEWMTELGPEDKKLMLSQNLINFFNTQTQKINSQLGATEKMFVENTSDRSAQLGQQSGQAITEFGQMMKAG
ncbi:hypothetical protein [Candidatus Rhabdochlamydia porcellionis]|jgi:hypothetical protein|uniref:Uncharacterized protein n=1 Tax=Candidatus Rhabdochlamydia porcellionis TaxID=225148 RepID=A0ABX8Z5T6_9BACT|nr:hypothetical protein [Candidatus Rhabdochlamydia porcellionis]QZA59392.1 hypothetical protein RHAB15C_0001278 [Candidatus Rhabdochlamydia porcellionis]